MQRSQAAIACDFAAIDTVTRTVYPGGITEYPTGAWTTQAARNLFLRHGRQPAGARALVRDRGSRFIDTFDEIFRTDNMKVLNTPVRAPAANSTSYHRPGQVGLAAQPITLTT